MLVYLYILRMVEGILSASTIDTQSVGEGPRKRAVKNTDEQRNHLQTQEQTVFTALRLLLVHETNINLWSMDSLP
jgi:hypothetical protein